MMLTHCFCIVLILYSNVALEAEEEHSEIKNLSSQSAEQATPATFHWESGIVPYVIRKDYDDIIADRVRSAMHTIESASCVLFKEIGEPPSPNEPTIMPWLSIQNPDGVRECTHTTLREEGSTTPTKAILILGFDCMQRRDILHALLHALAFRDEVTHPQRDMYIRIMWPNIQPKYRSLFWMRTADTPHKMVEYDSMSIMHFHDRAYSINGGATITPMISGLLIAPSDNLSQLDVMKLRLAFGHECNKRKVGNLLQTCQNALQTDADEEEETDEEHKKNYIPSGTEAEQKEARKDKHNHFLSTQLAVLAALGISKDRREKISSDRGINEKMKKLKHFTTGAPQIVDEEDEKKKMKVRLPLHPKHAFNSGMVNYKTSKRPVMDQPKKK